MTNLGEFSDYVVYILTLLNFKYFLISMQLNFEWLYLVSDI